MQLDRIRKLEEEIKRLSTECKRLQKENDRLRAKIQGNPPGNPPEVMLEEHAPGGTRKPLGPPPSGTAPTPRLQVTSASSPDDKIALFRRLFRGRDDVYAKRWENKSGRSGYSPACKNEWVRHVCRKRCSQCNNADYLPLTDQIIKEHLSGKRTIGVYPLMLDETCWFLAVDFDGDHWHNDAFAFLAAADQLEVPAYLERSRSGRGGHIWIFFDRPLEASIARDLGATILTKAMNSRPELSFDSYDRFFPNQSTMPKGGFGNLIALPLQRIPLSAGHSAFVDNDLEPCPDQWAYLSEIRRMSSEEAVAIVQHAVGDNAITGVEMSSDDQDPDDGTGFADPWTTPWALPPSRKTPDEPIQGPSRSRAPLVLTERTAHLKLLATELRKHVKNVIVLRGGRTEKQREQARDELTAIPGSEERVIVATGRYIGEGFDDARLDTLFLTLPISWRGTIQQYAGRLHRSYEGKRLVEIYDYVDENVPMLMRMYGRRVRGYKSIGYAIREEE